MTEKKPPGHKFAGYRKPPIASRFRKGQSGNPRGRPRGRQSELPYEDLLGQEVVIREDGRERRVPADQAFLEHLERIAIAGDLAAVRDLSAAIQEIRGSALPVHLPTVINIHFVVPGSVDSAVEVLQIGKKLDRHRETARIMLEPWIVEAALARLGEKQLTLDEQKAVLEAIRTPSKVRWAHWWVVMP